MLIVDGDAQAYARASWPESVLNITVVSKNRIRVNYHPRLIGARKSLSDPFFQHMKLAPPSPSAVIARERACLCRTFYLMLFSCVCTIPVLVLAWTPLPKHDVLYGTISLVLASIVHNLVGRHFYISATRPLLFSRMIDMHLLVVLSTTAAYIYSIAAYAYLLGGKPLVIGQFFETSTLLITLIVVGQTVSAYARQRAVKSITIESLQTNTAMPDDQSTGVEEEIDARVIQYQDIFKVSPDTSIVTDGIILTGESEVDESLITGESALIPKGSGDNVMAGTSNHFGTLKVSVTRLSYENTIKMISALVDEAESSKPKI